MKVRKRKIIVYSWADLRWPATWRKRSFWFVHPSSRAIYSSRTH
jgi:hypothetical protein